jgi:hypothetical protein
MSDVDSELTEVHAEDLDDDEGPPVPMSTSRDFQALPEGYLTLTGFAKFLAKPRKQGGRHVLVKPQVLYSTAKNTKSFPVEKHVDGRQIISVDKGLEWWDQKEEKRAERLAEQANAALPEEDDETDE